jgi:hypothetical protein
VVGSPAISSVRGLQATLDGRILSDEEFAEIEDELNRAPCDKKCLLALEDVCRCRCAGLNHGKWVRGAVHNTSLDVFDSEGAPIVSRDIMRGKFELMLLARREIIVAYSSIRGPRG